ncbi:MAG: nucleotidyl transferase AbiEii/AbiGii toxin family protein [Patescibacteria group bacterium]|jgi:predicted nucleotidyltransferase component of viral defense system
MIEPKQLDILHKAKLFAVLQAVADNAYLCTTLRFKGGTYAALMGYLNRFSVDLDFDYIDDMINLPKARANIETLAQQLELNIKDQSQNHLQYFFQYQADNHKRNTLKLEAYAPAPKANEYIPVYFPEIDRTLQCETIETMFANKLAAVLGRYRKHKRIAGRDIFDVSQFFQQKFHYKPEILLEIYPEFTIKEYFAKIITLIKTQVSQKIIDENLNMLLSPLQFQLLRKTIKQTTLDYLQQEYAKF